MAGKLNLKLYLILITFNLDHSHLNYMAATAILHITPEDFEKCQPFGKIQLKKFVVINEKGSILDNIVTYSSCRKFAYHA